MEKIIHVLLGFAVAVLVVSITGVFWSDYRDKKRANKWQEEDEKDGRAGYSDSKEMDEIKKVGSDKMRYRQFVNRENLIEKEFKVKVAYPKSIQNEVTEMSIYNGICGGTNYIECEVKETLDLLTLQNLKNMLPDTIFDFGVEYDREDHLFMTGSDRLLRWIAIRGGEDWAIYCHFAEYSVEWISKHGDKVISEKNIRKLVPCTDEVFQLYRY